MRRAAAAGALPAAYFIAYELLADGPQLASESEPDCNAVWFGASNTLAGADGKFAQFCAVLEQAMLLPSDDEHAPHGFRFWNYANGSVLAALDAGRRNLTRTTTQCSRCNGLEERLYFAESPTFAAELARLVFHFGAPDSSGSGGAVPASRCSCRTCDGCNARADAGAFKRCAACEYAYYCSRTCQAKHWPEHKRLCLTNRKALEMRRKALDPTAS